MKKVSVFFAVCLLFGCGRQEIISTPTPERAAGQGDVLQLACEPIPVVRIGFVGLGMRGKSAVRRMMSIDSVEIKAVCDLEQHNLDEVQDILVGGNLPKAAEYTGENGWRELCGRDDLDLVYVCTDWLSHTPIAVYAMQHGKHVATEVPAATTVDECWQLVEAAEKNRRHCMMLENCCYDRFELATLNMAQQGLFGEIVHVEGAYIHDLRSLSANDRLSEGSAVGDKPRITGYWNNWRLKYNAAHTGNPYPTHGLGPVCQILDIHRGDRMDYLVSVSSGQFGITEYMRERFGEGSPQAGQDYALGDMNVTMIRTHRGKTIMVQHNVTSPRPYSRIHMVSGTKGFAQKWPVRQMAFEPNGHETLSQPAMDSLLAAYDHRFYKIAGEQAGRLGAIAHGGMDYIMDYRLIYCLRRGLPLDEDVYDAAEWSSLVELTEISAVNHGAPVEIPDFTRGAWNKLKGFKFAE
ncbi:MAG: Gfo/Idh/MocA family oxidoreductase [Rikenellaceae bacterium]|nr:Gfo/Idh/MocA family oxidoreductase [Rikenellaceae bacterium]